LLEVSLWAMTFLIPETGLSVYTTPAATGAATCCVLAGAAFDTSLKLAAVKFSTSDLTILPLGPVPLILLKLLSLIPFFSRIFLASGVMNTLSDEFLVRAEEVLVVVDV
jgi:hypothetical protein